MWFLTAVFAACTALSVQQMTVGNPTAINGVIGAGVMTLALAALALIERGT
jgi:hypothetical protein